MVNKIQTVRKPRFGFDRNSPLGRFWRWWSGELTALIPLWLRQSSRSIGNTLLVEVDPQAIVLRRSLQSGLVEQGRLDLRFADQASRGIAFQALLGKQRKRDDRIALWLSDAQFLIKQIDLPLAAAENLRQVLGFEMDRHTPFKADQVYFDFRVVKRDGQNNRITVKLAAAPRFAVDAALDLLARLGAPAQAIYVAGAAEGDDVIDLMPIERRLATPTVLHLLNLGVLLLVLTLALTAIAIPILQKRQASIAMLPRVEHAKQQATATDALRREWEKLSAQYNFVLDKKHAAPPLIVQLDELTRLLPDDTWVQQLDLKGKEFQIQGETASSSKLIALFEGAKTLRDPSFRSTLTKGSMPNSERFHLVAEVKPLPASALAVPVAPAPVPAATPSNVQQPNGKIEPGKADGAAGKPAAPQSLQSGKPETKPNSLAPPSTPKTPDKPVAKAPSNPVVKP